MDTVLNVDLDFFTQPTYIGSYFGDKEWTEYNKFQSSAKIWLKSEEFLNTLGIDKPLKGASTIENRDSFLNIKKAFDIGLLKKGNTKIVQFDAHPNTYYWNTKGDVDHWKLKDFKNYNVSLAFFREKLVDTITWVVPDYMNGELLNKHFKNFEILKDRNIIIPVVSSSFLVRLKMVRWSEFARNAKKLNWKFFSLATNNRMCVYDHEQLLVLLKHIRKY